MDAPVSRVSDIAGRIAARESVTARRVDHPRRQPSLSLALIGGR